jgi:aminoglycoside phosphotransferase (APT) family kinase protein
LIAFDDQAAITIYLERLLPPRERLMIERVAEGGSTIVYRVRSGGGTAYLRIAPEEGVSLAAEVAAHRQLAALGVRVPAILEYEPHYPPIARSMMLVGEIAGQAIGYSSPPPAAEAIVAQAGRDLALVNQIVVQGYGWANRVAAGSGQILAEHATPAGWLQGHFAAPLAALAGCGALPNPAAAQLAGMLDRARVVFADQPAALAHGDFDVTHIYYAGETYTGMIDFGEIRGAPWLYDLSHFAIECGRYLPALLAGYADTRALGPADHEHMQLLSILIAARRVGGRILQRRPPHPPDIEYLIRTLVAATGGAAGAL